VEDEGARDGWDGDVGFYWVLGVAWRTKAVWRCADPPHSKTLARGVGQDGDVGDLGDFGVWLPNGKRHAGLPMKLLGSYKR